MGDDGGCWRRLGLGLGSGFVVGHVALAAQSRGAQRLACTQLVMSLFRTKGGKTSALRMPCSACGRARPVFCVRGRARPVFCVSGVYALVTRDDQTPYMGALGNSAARLLCGGTRTGSGMHTDPREQGRASVRLGRAVGSMAGRAQKCKKCVKTALKRSKNPRRDPTMVLGGPRLAASLRSAPRLWGGGARGQPDLRGRWRPWGTMGDHGGRTGMLETVGDARACRGHSTPAGS